MDYKKSWNTLKAESGYRWCQPHPGSNELLTIERLMSNMERRAAESEESAQQHLTKQGSEPAEISLLIDRYENMSPNGFYAYVTSRLPKWRKLLPC